MIHGICRETSSSSKQPHALCDDSLTETKIAGVALARELPHESILGIGAYSTRIPRQIACYRERRKGDVRPCEHTQNAGLLLSPRAILATPEPIEYYAPEGVPSQDVAEDFLCV